MVLGDFNHDGKVDIASSGNQLAFGNGDGTFQQPIPILDNPPDQGFTWIAAGDVNHDGWTDLLATQPFIGFNGVLYVLLNDQKGGFTLKTIKDAQGPAAVMLGDFNGDGNLDAVVMETESASVYLGDGRGDFKEVQSQISYPFVIWSHRR